MKCLRHKIRIWRPPASCHLRTLKFALSTLRMYVAITRTLVCVYSHVYVHYCRILCVLCVYTMCVNVLCMVEVKTNHFHLHNKLSLAYVIFVHSVNNQLLPITLPHTPVVSQTTQPDEKPLAVTQYHFTFWPDHGVPKCATSLISFIRRVQKAHNKDNGVPLLVHCSTGVGHTGTFIPWTPCWRGSKQRRLSMRMSS